MRFESASFSTLRQTALTRLQRTASSELTGCADGRISADRHFRSALASSQGLPRGSQLAHLPLGTLSSRASCELRRCGAKTGARALLLATPALKSASPLDAADARSSTGDAPRRASRNSGPATCRAATSASSTRWAQKKSSPLLRHASSAPKRPRAHNTARGTLL